eukprot:3350278-Amphidinium_carterae.2
MEMQKLVERIQQLEAGVQTQQLEISRQGSLIQDAWAYQDAPPNESSSSRAGFTVGEETNLEQVCGTNPESAKMIPRQTQVWSLAIMCDDKCAATERTTVSVPAAHSVVANTYVVNLGLCDGEHGNEGRATQASVNRHMSFHT